MSPATDLTVPSADTNALSIDTTGAPGPFIVVHTLTTVTGVNLNSDMDGLPKQITYGGTERMRISAQSLTRAIRTHIRHRHADDDNAGQGRLLPRDTARCLEAEGIDPSDSVPAAALIVAAAGLSINMERPGETKAIAYVRTTAAAELARVVLKHWDELTGARQDMEDAIAKALSSSAKTPGARRRPRTAATAKAAPSSVTSAEVAANVPTFIATAARTAFSPGSSTEIALFGRMLAELPNGKQNSAVQIGHATGVDPLQLITDDYTAKDDFKDFGVFGSAMRGTQYLGSATLYRFTALDRNTLRSSLSATGLDPFTVERLAQRAEREFVTAATYAVPAARSSRTGSSTLPTLAVAASCNVPANAMPIYERALAAPAGHTAAHQLAGFLNRLPPGAGLRGGVARWISPDGSPAPNLPDELTVEGI